MDSARKQTDHRPNVRPTISHLKSHRTVELPALHRKRNALISKLRSRCLIINVFIPDIPQQILNYQHKHFTSALSITFLYIP